MGAESVDGTCNSARLLYVASHDKEGAMDATDCYLEIMKAMDDGELVLARERALALKDWFARGGFYPAPEIQPVMDQYLENIIRRTTHLP